MILYSIKWVREPSHIGRVVPSLGEEGKVHGGRDKAVGNQAQLFWALTCHGML